MKPNFALTLSFDGIGLLHRAHPGWHLVGDVALDSEDLTAALGDLREKARALDPSGMTTKLVIPNEQIKYLSFDEGTATGDALQDEVRRHLDGKTPYSLDELVYDWSVGAGQVHVAAVARETLTEAEHFARDHAFNALCFVAIPETGQFVGEPFFGETSHANTLMKGEGLTRDNAPVRILGAASLPVTEGPVVQADTEAEDQPEPSAPEPAADAGGTAQPDTQSATPETADQDTPDENADAAPDAEDPTPEETAPVAFTSIRASRDVTAPAASAPKLAGAARGADAPAKPAARVTGTPDDALSEGPAASLGASLHPDTDTDIGARLHDSPDNRAPTPDAAPPPRKGLTAGFRTGRDKSQAAAPKATKAASPAEAHAAEAHRMTIFGARGEAPVGGKPRYLGLILTAILLLFLVSVAAWASIFLDDGLARFFRDDDTEIAATPDVTAPAAPTPADSDSAEQAEQTDGVALASLPDDQTTAKSDADSGLSRPAPAELTPDEARARYAATGIWQRAPRPLRAPHAGTSDDVYQASIDSDVPSSDAVALPEAARLTPDARPPTPASPAAAGTRYTLDERGMVEATTEGALTPSGVQVFAGPPPLTPDIFPDRPGAIAMAQPPEELKRLMGVRPKLRPDDLAEQNERGQLGLGGRTRTELATLRPKLRPESAQEAASRARAKAEAEAEDARTAQADAVAQALEEAQATEDTPFAGATPQAVAASLKPNQRPGNFDSVVKQAQKRATTQPVSASQRVQPRAPTGTTVASAATTKNQVNLRKVNLIGVYGTPSNRRALVRLASGRYKKVEVGDRLDRGRVTAIGDSELRYKKGSRNITLRLPRG